MIATASSIITRESPDRVWYGSGSLKSTVLEGCQNLGMLVSNISKTVQDKDQQELEEVGCLGCQPCHPVCATLPMSASPILQRGDRNGITNIAETMIVGMSLRGTTSKTTRDRSHAVGLPTSRNRISRAHTSLRNSGCTYNTNSISP